MGFMARNCKISHCYLIDVHQLCVTLLFRCRAAGLFGLAFIVAGLLGTVAGAELSKYIGRRTLKAECYVCALSLFGAVPFIYFGLIVAFYSKCISADWVCCYLLFTDNLILIYLLIYVCPL